LGRSVVGRFVGLGEFFGVVLWPVVTRAKLEDRLNELLAYERPVWARTALVAGIDEVGAGPLAGPVTAACVVLNPSRVGDLLGVDDSKKVTAKRRDVLALRIRESALAVGLGRATAAEIDRYNVLEAAKLAMRRAWDEALGYGVTIDEVLVDARSLEGLDRPQQALIRGDSLSLSIAAASIVAKVHRDAEMMEADRQYPGYGFARHKGYGTQAHLQALADLGPTPLHRMSFAPVRNAASQIRFSSSGVLRTI
jgi:ribonuclease HII